MIVPGVVVHHEPYNKMIAFETVKSLFYFVLAGVFEIGGGYLIWLWLREGNPLCTVLWGRPYLWFTA